MKQAAIHGMSVKRLYNLRPAILDDVAINEKDGVSALPESLARVS